MGQHKVKGKRDADKRKDELINEPGVLSDHNAREDNVTRNAIPRDGDERYRTLFNNVNDAIFIMDLSGSFTDVNQVAIDRLGYSREELLAMKAADIDTPEYAVRVAERTNEIRRNGHAVFESAHVRRDGSIIPVEISSRIIEEDGQPKVLSIARDITERKQFEEDSRAARDMRQLIMNNIPQGIFWKDRNSTYLGCNNVFAKAIGLESAGDIVGKTDYDLPWSPEQAEWFRGYDRRIMDNDVPEYDIIEQQREADGKLAWVETNKVPLHDVRGNVIGVLGTYEDITERKQAEEKLRENHRFTTTLMGNLPGMVYRRRNVIDYKMEFLSSGCLKLTGYKIEDLFNNHKISYGQLIHPDDRERVWDEIQVGLTDNWSYNLTYRIITAGQEEKWVLDQGRGIIKNGKMLLEGFIIDITERKRAEEELGRRETSLSLAQRIARLGSWSYDIKTDRNFWSREVCQMLGLTTDRECMTFDELLSYIHPGDVEKMKEQTERMYRDNIPFNEDMRIVRPDGTILFIHSECIIEYDEKGNPSRLDGFVQDITERKQAEEALRVAKAQAELYVDLMSHDINNMNQLAMGYLELALQKLETDKNFKLDNRMLIENPMQTLTNSSALIKNVRKLQILTTEGIKITSLDIDKIFRELEEMSFHSQDREVIINLPHVPGYMVEANELLKDVFVNLITNAVKHSDGEKPLNIDVKVVPVIENGRRYLKCMVEDNGPGIPDWLKDKLFNRFQRGASKSHGRGLGLYLVKTLVEGYQGKVWVEDRVKSDYTKGARFVVMLPAVDN